MILVRILLETPVSLPGRRPAQDIEPAHPDWKGWEFAVGDGRLLGTSPPGFVTEPPESVRTEMAANHIDPKKLEYIISEPLHRVRLIYIAEEGDARYRPYGPSPRLVETQKAQLKATAEANAAIEVANAALAEAAPVKSHRFENLARARAAKAAKHEPKRPPWAGADPTPPPSPPEEDVIE